MGVWLGNPRISSWSCACTCSVMSWGGVEVETEEAEDNDTNDDENEGSSELQHRCRGASCVKAAYMQYYVI